MEERAPMMRSTMPTVVRSASHFPSEEPEGLGMQETPTLSDI